MLKQVERINPNTTQVRNPVKSIFMKKQNKNDKKFFKETSPIIYKKACSLVVKEVKATKEQASKKYSINI